MLSSLAHRVAPAVAASAPAALRPSALMSMWSAVPTAPADPILGVSEAFKADTDPSKMNVGVGAYRTDEGKPVVLECVREAERRIAGAANMEYLPIAGDKDFVNEALKVVYGEQSPELAAGRVAAIQTLSGTGSCRIMAEFMKRFAPGAPVYIPKPTWSNHHNIWRDAGVSEALFRYYDPATRGLDFSGLMEDLGSAPRGAFVLLHACAHNPTGVDPNPEQWKEMSALFKDRGLFPVFDSAYQGFASGDFARDAQSIRTFLDDGHQVALAQSFAKNFGMYGQRIGTLSLVCDTAGEVEAVESQLKAIARPMYSNPPMHGALLVKTVLSDPALKAKWFVEVKAMADRIIKMRELLRSNLEKLGSPHNWQHITDQIGMFCFSGMTPEQVDRLTAEHHVYLTRNGRISMAGVTTGNVEHLAAGIHEVTK